MKRMIASTAMAVAMLAATEAWAQEATITVDPIVEITEFGAQASVSGTLTCPPGWVAFMFVDLVQIQKGGKVFSSGFVSSGDIQCTGTVQDWELVALTAVPFKPGHATAFAFIEAFDPETGEFDFDETAEAVKIQRAR